MADFTAQLDRTASFGAPYTWTQKGVNSVLERFQQEYEGPDEPPIVHYDGNSHLFSMSTNERTAVNQFSKILSGMIQFSQRHAIDLMAEPLMLQVAGTSLTANIGEMNDYGLSMNTLVDIVEDSDDSSDDSSSSGMGVAYWKPARKDISILSNEIALAISTVTESYFYFEHDTQRVKIVGGSTQTALKKLETMELLLEHLHRHRHGSASHITQNFVSFTSEQPGKGVEYVSIDRQQHYDRILVPPALQKDLHRALIGEERVYSTSNRWATPANLLLKPALVEYDESGDQRRPAVSNSKIWSSVQITSIGSAENAKPRVQVKSTNTNGTVQAPSLLPSKYLDASGQSRMRHWQQNVNPEGDPTVPAERPTEPELPSDEDEPITRRTVEDSDSDNESIVRPPIPRRVMANSDDEEETTVRAADTLALGLRNPFNQTDEIRQRRANRSKDANKTLLNLGKEDSNAVIQAKSFYANIPRDLEEGEEIAPQQNEKASRQQSFAAIARQPRRAFGLDGANDDDGYNHPSRQISQPDPAVSELYAASSQFDPSAYGLQKRQERAQRSGASSLNPHRTHTTPQKHQEQNQVYQSHSPVDHLSSVSSNPVLTWPGLVSSGNTKSSNQSPGQRRVAKTTGSLVQYNDGDDGSSKPPLKPPPGLIIRETDSTTPGEQHPLDGPLDEIQRPPIKPRSDEPVYTSEEASFSTSSSSGPARSVRGHYVPQTKISRPDLAQMSGDVLRNLMNARSTGQKATGQKARLVASPNQDIERIQEEDEVSTRKFYNTMNLQAPNKGRKSGKQGAAAKNSQISKAQQALRDEFLPIQPASQPPSKRAQGNSRPTETEASQKSSQRPSQSVLNAARSNPALAAHHKDALLNEALDELTSDFMKSFSPALDASRAFSGRLEFEMQIGQLMIMPSTRINPNKVYEVLKWQSAFASDRIVVNFTNILTNQGFDVDGILDGKTNKTQNWSDLPGPARAMLEFTCHDNTGQHFKLLVKEDGSHTVTSEPLVVSKIGIHCPGRIWDTCAVLSGSATWQASKIDLGEEIKNFVSTLYMKAGMLAMVYFRPPANNSFAVSSVLYKRTSLHDSQIPEAQNIQLKITEVKSLTIHSHRDDKKLLVAFEKDQPNKEPGAVDLHYEVALIDKRLNAAFESNQTICVGDVSNSAIDFKLPRARVLLRTTLQLLGKIDWIGQLNYGSLVRLQDIKAKRDERLGATLPPNTRIGSVMQPYIPPAQGFTARSSISPTIIGASSPRTAIANAALPGVRAGVPAQLYRDGGSGNPYYFGPGGAKIPFIESDSTVTSSEILPGDSASQYGGSRRQMQRSMRNDDKPPGFW